jgi:hypothetical protein
LDLRTFFEENHRRYALSTVRATFKTYRHWVRSGYSEKHSMDNAIKYGVAQIQSIVETDSLSQSIGDFEMMSTISAKIATALRERQRKLEAVK